MKKDITLTEEEKNRLCQFFLLLHEIDCRDRREKEKLIMRLIKTLRTISYTYRF